MNKVIVKHLNHYQYIYLLIMIILGSGFLFGIVMELMSQPVFVLQKNFFDDLITLDNIQTYMYLILLLYLFIILNSFHVLGILLLSMITFIFGVHSGVYLIHLCQSFPNLIFFFSDFLFIICQWFSFILLVVASMEIALNVLAVTFVFKETLKISEVVHQFLNYGFFSVFILFISIIVKIYLLRI